MFKPVHGASVDAIHSPWRRTQLRASHLQRSQQLRNGRLGPEGGYHHPVAPAPSSKLHVVWDMWTAGKPS